MKQVPDSTPLYVKVRDAIRARYVQPRLSVGGRLPSDRELAKEFATTTTTVAKALHELAQAGLLIRRVGAGGTSVVAQGARKSAIGVFYGGPILDGSRENAYYGLLDKELQAQLRALGREVRHHLDLRPATTWGTPLPTLIDDIRAGHIGVVIAVRTSEAQEQWLRALSVPVVGANGVSFADGGSIACDVSDGVRQAVIALAALGCKRIAGIGNQDGSDPPSSVITFQNGMRTGLAEAGLDSVEPVSIPRHLLTGIDADERLGYLAFKAVWAREPRPDGVVVWTDIVALGVCRALHELGLKDGRDVRLAVHANKPNPWVELDHCLNFYVPIMTIAAAIAHRAISAERGEAPTDIQLHFCLSEVNPHPSEALA